MNQPVASHIFHLRQRKEPSAKGRNRENGLARLTSRDTWENSNARFVRGPFGSGFIAAIDPVAEEIFSSNWPHNPVMPLSTARVCALT